MHTFRSLSCLIAGFALAAVLLSSVDIASSEDDEAGSLDPDARSFIDLTSRVRRALTSSSAPSEFQMVVVATEHGAYIECLGHLEDEDGCILARKLRALGDLVAAGNEDGCEPEDGEEEDESETVEEDE